MGFPGSSDGKASAYNVGDLGPIPGSARSPGEGNGNPLQYSCLENPMDGGAWWATVHRSQSQTRLCDFTSLSLYLCLRLPRWYSGKESASQCRFLGWEDPLKEGMATPFQYSCLENPMDRGAWCATVHRVTKSQTQLRNLNNNYTLQTTCIFHSTLYF